VIKKWTWRGRVRLPIPDATGPHFITREIRQHGSNGVTIFPSWYFFPKSLRGEHYDGPGQPYADHFYSTAFGTYEVHGWRRPTMGDSK
jgi:hypothetical protein